MPAIKSHVLTTPAINIQRRKYHLPSILTSNNLSTASSASDNPIYSTAEYNAAVRNLRNNTLLYCKKPLGSCPPKNGAMDTSRCKPILKSTNWIIECALITD